MEELTNEQKELERIEEDDRLVNLSKDALDRSLGIPIEMFTPPKSKLTGLDLDSEIELTIPIPIKSILSTIIMLKMTDSDNILIQNKSKIEMCRYMLMYAGYTFNDVLEMEDYYRKYLVENSLFGEHMKVEKW